MATKLEGGVYGLIGLATKKIPFICGFPYLGSTGTAPRRQFGCCRDAVAAAAEVVDNLSGDVVLLYDRHHGVKQYFFTDFSLIYLYYTKLNNKALIINVFFN